MYNYLLFFLEESLLVLSTEDLCKKLHDELDSLRSSRPTAVNLFNAIDDVQEKLAEVCIK